MRRRTTDAGKEMARRLGLPKEMIELCTTSSPYHIALKEMVAGREDLETYLKEKFIEDVTNRFAEVTKDLRRITGFGTGVRAITVDEISMGLSGGEAEVAAAPEAVGGAAMVAEELGAAKNLRVIEGGEESLEVSDLLAAASGSVESAVAAPLAAPRSRSQNK